MAMMPPEDLTPSEWADKYRVLTSPPANAPGPYSGSEMPHLAGIMDAFVDPDIEEIDVMAAARGGKTTVMETVIGYLIHIDPCLIIGVMPTIAKAEQFARDQIETMCDATEPLASRILKAAGSSGGSQIRSKVFPGGRLTIVSTESDSELRGITARVVLMDEVSAYGEDLGGRGDVVKLARERARSATFRKKIGLFSTPGDAGKCRIEREWKRSGRRQYLVKCPNCDHRHELDFFRCVVWDPATVDPDTGEKTRYPETARYVCPDCKAEWNDATRARAIDAGSWTKTPPVNGRVGFNFSTLVNKHIPLAKLVAEYLEAKDDRQAYKQFVTEVLGQTWEDRAGNKLVVKDLQARQADDMAAGMWAAEVPDGVAFAGLLVDTQGTGEDDAGWQQWAVIGYGLGDECWVIDQGVIPVDPRLPACWAELDGIYRKARSRADGSTIRPSLCLVDAGGGHTQRVIDECARRAGAGWFAIRGNSDAPGTSAAKAPVWSSLVATGNNAGRWRNVGSQRAKDYILDNVQLVTTPGPGFVHFGPCCDAQWLQQVLNEKKLWIKAAKDFRWGNPTKKNRSEAADLLTYSYVAAVAYRTMFRVQYDSLLRTEAIRRRGGMSPRVGSADPKTQVNSSGVVHVEKPVPFRQSPEMRQPYMQQRVGPAPEAGPRPSFLTGGTTRIGSVTRVGPGPTHIR